MAFIELQNVVKSFVSMNGKTSVAVQSFSLDLARGEFFCLLGPSGCGKSTVLSMLAGFEQPTTGAILLDGQPVRGPASDRGVIFQGDDSLYPWLTALENVAFGLRIQGMGTSERRKVALEYLHLVGLHGQQDKFPAELSGGMKQRIQIARGLATQPKMLLMDEPFGALDAQTRHIMQHELRKIWRATGTSIVFITHDVDEAILLSTRVGVMTAGPGGTLKGTVSIEMDDARDRADPRYTGYFSTVYEMIREEVTKASNQNQGVTS